MQLGIQVVAVVEPVVRAAMELEMVVSLELEVLVYNLQSQVQTRIMQVAVAVDDIEVMQPLVMVVWVVAAPQTLQVLQV
jgi:hypothetical protein